MPSFQVNAKWAALSEVIPGLFISGVSALNPEDLNKNKISCIINATNEVPNLNIPGIDRMKLWVADEDDVDLKSHLDLVSDHIHMTIHTGGSALVHCVAGVSRSATIILAYLLKYHSRSLRDAYHLLSSRRPLVRPNLGFWRQLMSYERDTKGRVSVRLIQTKSDGDGQLLPDVYLPIIVPHATSRIRSGSPTESSCSSDSTASCSDTQSCSPSPPSSPMQSMDESSCYGENGEGGMYMPSIGVINEMLLSSKDRERRGSGPKGYKFVPTLATLRESEHHHELHIMEQ